MPVDKKLTQADLVKKAEAEAIEDVFADPPTPEEVSKSKRVVVDYQAFIDAADEDTEGGVDAVVEVPNFVMDSRGHLLPAEDQDDLLELRLAPFLTGSALGVIGSYRHGISLTMMPLVFEMLLHPDDVPAWRRRMGDATDPVPSAWLTVALAGMLKMHGLMSEDSPGKRAG